MQSAPRQGSGNAGALTVDELTRELKTLLEGAFPQVSVEGEIVSCRRATSGHLYFNLQGDNATLPCVMFKSAAWRLYRPPQNGDRVVCTGGIELYPPHGRYQMVVHWLRLGGEGELLAALEALKRKLASEGLFDPARRRPLPVLPRRIGVVTSHTGAALRDIVRSIHARFKVPILLAAAPVQGEDSPPRLTRALNAVAAVHNVDVVVIGRGGGSLQDLWAFNDEGLARAIAACPKPVVSAVGHEIDNMLSDFVADARAATPTAVGELVVPNQHDIALRLAELRIRAARGLNGTVRHARARLGGLSGRLRDPRRLVRERWLRLDDLRGRLARALTTRQRAAETRQQALTRRLKGLHPLNRLSRERRMAAERRVRLIQAMLRRIERSTTRLATLTARLAAMSPKAVLDRGYAIIRTDGLNVVRSHADVAAGDPVELLFAEGSALATVTETRAPEEDTP